jgi:hypothetical protein
LDPINQATLVATLIGTIIASLISVIGAIITIYKIKPDIRKTKADGDSAIADAAESVANGAKITNEMLMARITDMEKREKDRDLREAELRDQLASLQVSLADWQDWARRLVHQLKSHGYEPVPFKKVDGNTVPLRE